MVKATHFSIAFATTNMEKDPNQFEQLYQDIRDYVNTRQELLKLQVTEKSTRFTAHLISFLIIIPFFFLAFLFISFALAHLFAEWWGHEYAGYLTVTLLYLIIGMILLIFRKRLLVKPLKNGMIKMIFSKKTDD
ncbi:MAG: phage holin family protein [Sphingobacteriales bacterium]|nr:phage holin family protein [Sphingobacteriales bacterium]